MMREEDDEETLFDQQGLLGSGRKSTWDWEWIRRFLKTLALSLAFFALGLCISITGATLLELEERTQTSTEQISLIFTARSLGYLLGSIVGGVLFDYFDQQILLFYTLVLTGVATIAVPWCVALFALACMIAIQGLALGVLDTGGNMFCIKIWGKSSPPYMQALHFCFAVGAFVSPLLARPFLVGEGAMNSTMYSVSNIPVNIKLPKLSSEPGPHTQGNMHRLTDNVDWFTHTGHRRVLRDVETNVTDNGSVIVGGNTTVNSFNVTANVTSNAVSTTSTPRATKPVVADGKHLEKSFANGDKAKQPLLDHKDDERSDDLDGVDPLHDQTTVQNDASELNNNSLSGGSGGVNGSQANSTVNDDLNPVNNTQSNSTSTNMTSTDDTSTTTTASTTTLSTTSTTTTSTTTTSTTITTTTTTNTTPKPVTTTLTTTTATTPTKAATDESKNSTNSSSSTLLPTSLSTTTRAPKPAVLDMIASTLDAVKNMSKIQFAYMIIGLVLMSDAVFLLVLYCKDCKAGTLLHQVNALGPSPPPTPRCFRVSILSLLFLFFLLYVGLEVAFGGLVTTYAVESPLIQWSRPQGATLAALFWGSIAVGRGLAIFIARCFKPPCMLVTDLVFMLAGAVVLCFGLKATPVLLWVGTITLGFGMSSIFPTAVSWADCYYPLTGRAAAVFITGSGVGEMVIPVATGYLFEKLDSLWLMYVVMGLSVLVTLVFVCLQCIASRQPAPTSISKLGFLPLHNEEDNSIAMDDMTSQDNGNLGYTETTWRRQTPNNHVEDAEEETAKLVDFSD